MGLESLDEICRRGRLFGIELFRPEMDNDEGVGLLIAGFWENIGCANWGVR
jgi:hypothetical protein